MFGPISIVACLLLATPVVADTPQALLLNRPDIQVTIPGLNLTESKDITVQGSAPNQYYVIPWIAEYIKGVYQFGIGAAMVLAVAMIIFGGFVWMPAGGNANQVTTAKGYIIGAVTGIVLALGSYSILYLVNPNITKLSPLKVPIIGRIGLGNYCSPVVQAGETLYKIDPQSTEQPKSLTLGTKTDCCTQYSLSLDKNTTNFCIGSNCGSTSLFCTPNPAMADGKPTYSCGSQLAENCKVLNKDAPFVVSSHPPESACAEFNMAPGVLNQGLCVCFDASWLSLTKKNGCLWCPNDAYAQAAANAQREIDEKNAEEATKTTPVQYTKEKFCGKYQGGLQINQAFSDYVEGIARGDEGIACLIKYCQGL